MDGGAISFGPFRLLVGQRLLLDGEKPVRLGGRAFDILAALVERAGEVVSKDELIAHVWPQTFVEESNLKMQVSALRRALGDGQGGHRYVVTVPGRGYNFVARVSILASSTGAPPSSIEPTGRHNLPLAATRMIGREEAVAGLLTRLSQHQLVTIVGPGGIGKTTLALAVAERMIADYEHGVWLADLAPLSDASFLPGKVATALNLEIQGDDPLPRLVDNLGQNRMLLILDNCDQVIDAAARFAASILNRAPGVKILATSREPLGVPGEHEYRLLPLGSPDPLPSLTAAQAALFPAVQLFVERVSASIEDFALTDANARVIAEICRRLDGLPLAIEFAAPRVAVLGVEDLAAHLDDSLPLLGARHRAAAARHRTMRAVIDWSYGLLNPEEQPFFRALGVFTGAFTVEAASAVVAAEATPRIDVIDRLADLVSKSMVIADVSGAKPRFRLLETIRAYAIEKLDENGDRAVVARRHALRCLSLLEHAEIEIAPQSATEWPTDHARELDDVSAAIDWAFSAGGDPLIGVALTTAAVPLWTGLSLHKECRSRAKQALGVLGAEGAGTRRQIMKLHAALGASTSKVSEMGPAFTKVLDIAESLGDCEYQMRAIRGLYSYHTGSGRYRTALQFAQKFHDLAMRGSDPNERLYGEYMMGLVKHFLGDQTNAWRHLEQVLTHSAAIGRGQNVIRFITDLGVSARVFLARMLWLRGFSDQAVRTAEMSVAEAQATGHEWSVCYALALAACPIALWAGDLRAAAHYAAALLDHSRKYDLPPFDTVGSGLQGLISLKGGDFEKGSQRPVSGLEQVIEPSLSFWFLTGLSELAEGLARTGRTVEGLALLDAGIEQSEAAWRTPEMLRLKGKLLLLQNGLSVAETADDLFRQALDGARRQGTLSWELRAATSHARLLTNQGRTADAIASLAPVYNRFTEGFGTADLIAAKQLMDELGDADRR
jgi:predicted ATPase